MKRREQKIQELKDTARSLFLREGYRAAGISAIIEESGIAKTTLYRHFPSKEDLIVAVLKDLDEDFRTDMRTFVVRAGKTPECQLLATFDYIATWIESDNFSGCPFILAAGEFENDKNPIFQEAQVHKRLMIAYFEDLAMGCGVENPKALAIEINLLHEGAVAMGHIFKNPEPAHQAKEAAEKLLASAKLKS